MRARHVPIALGILFVLTAALAVAASPHFVRSATDVSRKGGDLVVTFKEAGLAAGARETITAGVAARVTYVCVNDAGRVPPGHRHLTTTRLLGTGHFTADDTGTVSGSLTLSPTSPPLPCPRHLEPVLSGVTYTRVRLSDLTSGAALALGRTVIYANAAAPR